MRIYISSGIFELNFYGTYHCMKAELEIMTQQKFGSIAAQLGPATFCWRLFCEWIKIREREEVTGVFFVAHFKQF